MAIANVGARWENGDQVFFSKITGATIMTLKSDGTLEINGGAPIADGSVTLAKLASDVTDAIDAKLTATQAAAQADSTAVDVAGIVADFNALLAKLRTADIIAT